MKLCVYVCACTSGVAEGFKVEGQLFHTLPGLLIVLGVLWAGDQGDRLGLRNLRSWSNTHREGHQPWVTACNYTACWLRFSDVCASILKKKNKRGSIYN